MILSILGIAACLTAITFLWPCRMPKAAKTPQQQWQEWETLRRELTECAEHFSWAPLTRLARFMVQECEERQREIADRRRE